MDMHDAKCDYSSGSKQSGIYPFNPQVISYDVVTKKSIVILLTVQEISKHCSGNLIVMIKS